MLRHLGLDHSSTDTCKEADTLLALKLLQGHVKEDRGRIAIALGSSLTEHGPSSPHPLSLLYQNDTQHLEHSADDRIAWLTQLNTNGVWLRPLCEQEVATRVTKTRIVCNSSFLTAMYKAPSPPARMNHPPSRSGMDSHSESPPLRGQFRESSSCQTSHAFHTKRTQKSD